MWILLIIPGTQWSFLKFQVFSLSSVNWYSLLCSLFFICSLCLLVIILFIRYPRPFFHISRYLAHNFLFFVNFFCKVAYFFNLIWDNYYPIQLFPKMLSFFKTVISLPSLVLIRGTHHTSLSTRSIREVFFIFLVWNWFADTHFFFFFWPLSLLQWWFILFVLQILIPSSKLFLVSVFPLILAYKHVTVEDNTTWQLWSQTVEIQSLFLPIPCLLSWTIWLNVL